jgi:hypothetical protein
MTLHQPEGKRILGFDNAHRVAHVGSKFVASPIAADHWQYDGTDAGKPYAFISAEQLIVDFFAAVEKKLAGRRHCMWRRSMTMRHLATGFNVAFQHPG